MIITSVRASKEYAVHTGSGLLASSGKIMREVCPKALKLLIVSETNVAKRYLGAVKDSAQAEGFEVYEYIFRAGEASKNIDSIAGMWGVMAKAGFTRTDLVAGLGGGVTTDMAGFAAASFLRGIDVVQIPTSLLAMVDAAVGGKTGIDLPEGKNQVGSLPPLSRIRTVFLLFPMRFSQRVWVRFLSTHSSWISRFTTFSRRMREPVSASRMMRGLWRRSSACA